MLALLAALVLGLWNLLGPPSASGREPVSRIGQGAGPWPRARRPARGEPAGSTDEDEDGATAPAGWLIASAGAAGSWCVLLGLMNLFEGDLFPHG